MTDTIREIHKDQAIRQWLRATDQALEGLEEWRSRLADWGDGGRLVPIEEIDAALGLLDVAGLADWWEACPAAGGVDGLAEALGAAED